MKSFELADGSVAKVYKTGTDEYAAEIWAGGTLIDTLTITGSPSYGQNNGLHVVLQPDGTGTSWVEGTPKPTACTFVVIDTPKQGGNSWKTTTTVVPKGAVKAGAENVAGSSGQAALIGAGGGLAALGAAGLGFALNHRRSQEG
ncbi:hypothetical protein Q5762_22640 [Streptomyces sp. P9(2023)]|uniref:hypothetical protein n=1 Tax=Streptomyces sp. P9(2023) TaxID=3064394 RepID=UPI0028F43FDA|nr:hypothetical protein [Streptomyces sp. P9(2023)]MDT9691094.1 hypothetical protein [Streptomyces sp. P9(2023)]